MNFKDFIENKKDFLEYTYEYELKGEKSIEGCYQRVWKEPVIGTKDKLIAYYSCKCASNYEGGRLLFILNREAKQIVFNTQENIADFHLDGYTMYSITELVELYKKEIKDILTKIIDEKLYVKIFKGFTLMEFQEYKNQYKDVVLLDYISSKLSCTNTKLIKLYNRDDIKGASKKELIKEIMSSILTSDITSLEDVSILMFSLMQLKKEDWVDFITSNDNIISNCIKRSYQNEVYFVHCLDLYNKSVSELGDLEKNKEAKELLEIVEALNKGGRTVKVNGIKLNNYLSLGNEVTSFNLMIGEKMDIRHVKEITFGKNTLYKK